MKRHLKHLPLEAWPEIDVKLFERAFSQAADPFDDDVAGGAHLKARTVKAIRFGYRRWLGWLVRNHPDSLALDPADRVNREHVRTYTATLATTMGSVSLAMRVAELYAAIRYMYPERDWAWLKAAKTRLEAKAHPKERAALPLDSIALQDLGFERLCRSTALRCRILGSS